MIEIKEKCILLVFIMQVYHDVQSTDCEIVISFYCFRQCKDDACFGLQYGCYHLLVCRMALPRKARVNVRALKDKRKRKKGKRLEKRVFMVEYAAFA